MERKFYYLCFNKGWPLCYALLTLELYSSLLMECEGFLSRASLPDLESFIWLFAYQVKRIRILVYCSRITHRMVRGQWKTWPWIGSIPTQDLIPHSIFRFFVIVLWGCGTPMIRVVNWALFKGFLLWLSVATPLIGTNPNHSTLRFSRELLKLPSSFPPLWMLSNGRWKAFSAL